MRGLEAGNLFGFWRDPTLPCLKAPHILLPQPLSKLTGFCLAFNLSLCLYVIIVIFQQMYHIKVFKSPHPRLRALALVL